MLRAISDDREDALGTAGWRHRSLEDLLATRGHWFEPSPLPQGWHLGPAKACFANAAAYAARFGLAYAEGYGLHLDGLAFTHA
ncbi:hypothetical protein GCM10010174_07150 [Kutzneria viridogrisea]